MRRAALALALLALTGCESFELTHLAPLEDAILGIDAVNGIARVVRVDTDPVQTTEIDLSEGGVLVLSRPDAPGEALVLTQGRIGDEDNPPLPAELVRVDRTGELDRWVFERQYFEARVSPSGRYVHTLAPFGRLVVENNIEVVDLDSPPGDANPISLSLRSLGGEVPTAAAFSEPLSWADGGTLRVAALFAAGQLSLFDLDAPDAPPVTVPTTVDGATVGPSPVEVRFVDAELVVRTADGSQLIVVSLLPRADGEQRFDVTLRTLATSGAVDSLAVDRRGDAPRLLALAGQRLYVFDLSTSIERVVELPSRYHSILQFEGPAPGDPEVRPRIVLWGSVSRLTFIELGAGASDVVDETSLPLAFRPDSVVTDASSGRLVVFERRGSAPGLDVAGSAGRVPVSVVDLFDRSALALTASGDVTRAAVSADLGDVWIASVDGYVSRFDVDSHEQEELWLEEDVASLLPLPGVGGRVLAFHHIRDGRFSILQPGVTEPRRVDGVF